MRGELAVIRRPPAVRATQAPALPEGDGTNHGQWFTYVTRVVDALARLRAFQEEMLARLAAVEASPKQRRDVEQWSANMDTARQFVYSRLKAHDARLAPYIDAIDRAGGWRNMAKPAYYEDF